MPDFFVKSNLDDFNKQFEEYAKWNKRQASSIINQKLYFIALQAMNLTKTTEKSKIANELNAQSEKYPKISLGELLVLRNLRNNGKMPKRSATLTKNMANYVQRLINTRASHTQFLRSGWVGAVKKLDYWNRKDDISSQTFSKRFAPKKPQGLKQLGKLKGDAKPALESQAGSSNCRGTIFNFIGEGKQDTKTINPILQEGLNKAVNAEIRSMRIYIERKFAEENRRRAAKGQFQLM